MRVCPKCGTSVADDVLFCPVDSARTVPAEEPAAGQPEAGADALVGKVLVQRYKILRKLGEGGMGVVYEAEHVVLGKHVALKLLREDFGKKSDLVARFKQEARSASIIGHENIIDVSDFGETDGGNIFFVMEMLHGEDLAEVLKKEGRLSLERAMSVMTQLCRALHAAHQKGIIHRDLKPENVFLVQREDRRDFVKILDFGIAKMTTLDGESKRLTKTGVIFGTPEYMSPEQARGQTLDLRVDVYASGIMLYEMLSGQVPFTGNSFMAILTQHLFNQAAPLSQVVPQANIPPGVEAVVFKAIAKDRDARYANMTELLQDLQRAAAGVQTAARVSQIPATPRTSLPGGEVRAESMSHPPAAVGRTRGTSARSVLALAAVVAGLAVAAVGIYLWRSGASRSSPAEGPAAETVDATVAFGPGLPFGPLPGGTDAGTSTKPPAADAAAAPAKEVSAPVPPDAATVAPAPDAAGAASDAPTPDAATVSAAADAGVPAPDAVQMILIKIITTPGGAKVLDEAGETLCTPTPCHVQAPLGSLLRLHARKNRLTGEYAFQVTAETTEVTIALSSATHPPPSRDAAGGARDDAGGGARPDGGVTARSETFSLREAFLPIRLP